MTEDANGSSDTATPLDASKLVGYDRIEDFEVPSDGDLRITAWELASRLVTGW